MMKEFGGIAVRLSRNPLGVLALTLVLVYGIAALSASFGTGSARSPITWFITLYPVAVLACLVYLVGWHHTKLYGPADFSDLAMMQTFLATGKQKATPAEEERRVKELPPDEMEARLLSALWVHQVNLDPKFETLWCFGVPPAAPGFAQYMIAAARLIGRGWAAMSDKGMIHLTHAGWEHCKKNYITFPPDIFFPNDPIQPDKAKLALGQT